VLIDGVGWLMGWSGCMGKRLKHLPLRRQADAVPAVVWVVVWWMEMGCQHCIHPLVNQSIHQSIDQPISQPTNKPIS
jgi:hypothetical protein